jgi:glutaredoxin-like YruB-family protein
MKTIQSHPEFLSHISGLDKSFLLLYKSGSEQSDCAYRNFDSLIETDSGSPVFAADVALVRDIHPQYGVSSVPSLLVFEKTSLVSVIKGCHEIDFYKALIDNAVFQTKAKTEGKEIKRVTVYSTPSCSWCNTLKSWLRKNNIPFSDVDVSRDQSAAEAMVRRSGQQGVPQTEINGQTVVGFDQTRLKQLLGIQ